MFQVDKNGYFAITGNTFTSEVIFISMYQVICNLPREASYEITLLHNESPIHVQKYSTEPSDDSSFLFMVYDSVCYGCDIMAQNCREHNVCIMLCNALNFYSEHQWVTKY